MSRSRALASTANYDPAALPSIVFRNFLSSEQRCHADVRERGPEAHEVDPNWDLSKNDFKFARNRINSILIETNIWSNKTDYHEGDYGAKEDDQNIEGGYPGKINMVTIALIILLYLPHERG